MITIDGGTGIIRHNGVEMASEKMVDEWRTNASQDQSNGAVVLASNWERNDRNSGYFNWSRYDRKFGSF